jgi:hypothetical protein
MPAPSALPPRTVCLLATAVFRLPCLCLCLPLLSLSRGGVDISNRLGSVVPILLSPNLRTAVPILLFLARNNQILIIAELAFTFTSNLLTF